MGLDKNILLTGVEMKNLELSNIIFTKDSNYAYKLRNKLNEANIKTDYVNDAEALLFSMFNNNRGLVFIDLKYARFLTLIKEYSKHQLSRNFCFIYLTDNKNYEVEFDNKLIFVSDYENVLQTAILAIDSLNQREKSKFTVPESYVENSLLNILISLDISTKHTGYELIKDSIKILINKQNKSNSIIMKEVYKEVGLMHSKAPANVEKSIRLALNKALQSNPEAFQNLFKNVKVSNSVILNFIAENIKNSYFNSSEYKAKFENDN